MQQINLVDASLLPPQRLVSGTRLVTLAMAGALLVLGHWGFERLTLAHALAAAIAAEAADTSMQAPNSGDGLADLREQVAQREALRDLLAADTLPQHPAALLRAVIDSLPPTLWLTEVEVARERALRITGGALDAVALDQFAERLAAVIPLRGVPVNTVRLEPAERDGRDGAPPSWRFVLASSNAPMAGER